MALIDWWSELPVESARARWSIRSFDSAVGTGFSPVEEAVARRGAWVCRMMWPDGITHDEYVKLSGFFGQGGFLPVFKVENQQYRQLVGGVTGAITTNGVSSGGTDTLNVSVGSGVDPLLEIGDLIEVPGAQGEPRLHRVKQRFLLTETTIRIDPFLAADVADATTVVHRGTRALECTMRKTDPESVGVELIPGPDWFAPGFDVGFVEIIRPNY